METFIDLKILNVHIVTIKLEIFAKHSSPTVSSLVIADFLHISVYSLCVSNLVISFLIILFLHTLAPQRLLVSCANYRPH